MFDSVTKQANTALLELLEVAKLKVGDIFVVGCSSSEIVGGKIGKQSSFEAARAIFSGISPELRERGIYLASQCCDHLNRALVIESEAAERYNLEVVNAIPQATAGGTFATVCYGSFFDPVLAESATANAGFDIGGTLIGMHLAHVAVPVRVSITKIGEANLVCARTRPKFVGGERAVYNEGLM